MPLKKSTYSQRQEKKENISIEKQINDIHDDLIKAKKALLQGCDDAETWRWVALESFRKLQRDEFPQKNKLVIREKNIALYIAREAQAVINFTS